MNMTLRNIHAALLMDPHLTDEGVKAMMVIIQVAYNALSKNPSTKLDIVERK